jgi:hypothetical protein
MSKVAKKTSRSSFNPDWKNALKVYLDHPNEQEAVVYYDEEFSAIADKYPKGVSHSDKSQISLSCYAQERIKLSGFDKFININADKNGLYW